MKAISKVDIKNCQNHFFNSMININNFDPSLLCIDQISFKSTDFVIYDINISQQKVLIMQILFILFLIMYMYTLKKTMEINT